MYTVTFKHTIKAETANGELYIYLKGLLYILIKNNGKNVIEEKANLALVFVMYVKFPSYEMVFRASHVHMYGVNSHVADKLLIYTGVSVKISRFNGL